MEADSFSLKLTLSVFAKDDKASCPSLINLSSTPMSLFCRAMPNHKNPIKCYHNNIHLMGLEKCNNVCLGFNFNTRWSCAATGSTSC